MWCAALVIEGLLGRPPGLCDGDLVSEGLDIIVNRIVTHPPSVNNIGQWMNFSFSLIHRNILVTT